MRTRPLVKSLPLGLLVVLALAACGGSKAPGVETAPSGGATQASIPTTPSVPPALSKKPLVVVPKGPPPSHLVSTDVITGTGQAASAGKTVTVNYVGVLYGTGKEFDSSWKNGQPATFPLSAGPGGVIPGWVQGIPGMKVGGRRQLIVPPNLAYGAKGSPPTIPPNSTLVFVVDLLSVA